MSISIKITLVSSHTGAVIASVFVPGDSTPAFREQVTRDMADKAGVAFSQCWVHEQDEHGNTLSR